MRLLETFDTLLESWRSVFPQARTFERARRLLFGLLTCLRMHLTSTAICASGRQFVDWSADYRVCARSPWEPRELFDVGAAMPSDLCHCRTCSFTPFRRLRQCGPTHREVSETATDFGNALHCGRLNHAATWITF